MKKVAIIYWSGTGNTQKMAEAVAEGVKSRGADAQLIEVSKASHADAVNADAVALGCPSMGAEVLEEMEMEPFVKSLEGETLNNKDVVLFGSYGWGDGQWMRDWEERMKGQGVNLLDVGLAIQETPDEEGLAKCRALGEKLVG